MSSAIARSPSIRAFRFVIGTVLRARRFVAGRQMLI
jgi:hypothetical protein